MHTHTHSVEQMDATIKGKGIASVTIAVTQDLRKDRFLERSCSRHAAKIKFAETSQLEIEESDMRSEHHFVLSSVHWLNESRPLLLSAPVLWRSRGEI